MKRQCLNHLTFLCVFLALHSVGEAHNNFSLYSLIKLDKSRHFPLAAQEPNRPERTNVQRTIREVDFFNFTYNAFCLGEEGQQSPVAVRNGETFPEGGGHFLVRSVTYGDLDGDGRDEAVVFIICNGGGTGNFSEGYVYSMRGGRPSIIATIAGGDRAHEGIASISIRETLLNVGRFGTDTGGACCPEYIETRVYPLAESRLIETGRATRAAYQDRSLDTSPQEINFAQGRTQATITETLEFSKTFTVRARAGQRMTVRLTSTDANDQDLVLLVSRRGDEDGLATAVIRNLRGSVWSGILPQSGDYSLTVIPFNGTANMRLEVSITGR